MFKPRTILIVLAAIWIGGFACADAASLVIDSLTGPVTPNEINSFLANMQGQTPPTNNFGDAMGHHTASQRYDALTLMYQISHNQAILDVFVKWADAILYARNDTN